MHVKFQVLQQNCHIHPGMWDGVKCVHDGRHRMKQLSAQSTKPTKLVVFRHEDGHSGWRKEWQRKEEDNITTGNVLEVQCLCFPRRYKSKESLVPQQNKCESSRKETLPFSCLRCLVDRSWGWVHPPRCPLLFLLAFQSWLASGFWQRRQLGQTVGGRRRKLVSPSYRLFCG